MLKILVTFFIFTIISCGDSDSGNSTGGPGFVPDIPTGDVSNRQPSAPINNTASKDDFIGSASEVEDALNEIGNFADSFSSDSIQNLHSKKHSTDFSRSFFTYY